MRDSLPRKAMWITGIALLLVGLLSQLPASVALNWALPAEIETKRISGTIWSGDIVALRTNGTTVGPLSWTLRPLALFRGRLGADIELGLPGGFFAGRIDLSGKRIAIRDAKAAVALAPLTRLSTIGPSEGNLRMTIRDALLSELWPVRLDGEAVLSDLRYPPVGDQLLGSYRLIFDPALADSRPAFAVAGSLQSLDGPFDLAGTLLLGEQRSYSMRATIATRPDADTQLRNALRVLGPAQADGRHALNFDGNL